MSSLLSEEEDPLSKFYISEEEAEQENTDPGKTHALAEEEDPLAKFYVDEETGQKEEAPYRDIVSENIRAAGYEPEFSEELERASERGMLEAYKSLTSGATIGASELIPGFEAKENATSEVLKGVGSFLPINFLIGKIAKPLINLAKKSPYFQKTLTSLANITGVGLGGGAYGGAKHAIEEKEFPSMNQVLEHGFEWAALDAILQATGKGGKFAIDLLKRQKKTGQPPFKIVNEIINEMKDQGIDVGKDKRVGAKALSILEDFNEGKPQLKGETRKVTPQAFKKMDDSINQLSEPVLPTAREETFNVNNIIENTENQAVREQIDSVGRRAVEDQELGKEIQTGINDFKKRSVEQYKPFYDEVEEAAQYLTTNPEKTARESGELIRTLEELRTNPTGYSTVIKNIETILEDVGYTIQRGKKGEIEQIIQKAETPLNKLMELGRRLNEVVEYDVLDRTIKDRLKPIVRAVKSDIRSALESSSEDLLESFNLAEEAHGITANKFNRKSIRAMRGTQSTEKIPKLIESATSLQDLRGVLSPPTMANVERHVLEQMNKMTEAKAQDYLRKVRSGLSKRSQGIADDIIASKRPISKSSPTTRKERLHEAIDSDLGKAMQTGQRPKKTLELWQNARGRKLVEEALESNPQKKELVEYLQKQSMQDMAQSILTKEGHIDFQKFNEIMNNPAMRANIKDLGGMEAVRFFNDLAKRARSIERNAEEFAIEKLGVKKAKKGERTSKQEKPTYEKGKQILERMAEKDYPVAKTAQKALDFLGFNGKAALTVFTVMKFGYAKALLVPLAGKFMMRLATSNKARQAFIDASKAETDPVKFIAAIEALGNALEEEEE